LPSPRARDKPASQGPGNVRARRGFYRQLT
jgi:hypothetical protein